MTFLFETYGCQMNSAESAALRLVCRERGWTEAAGAESADMILVNTCSVRNTAERRAVARIAAHAALKRKRRARGENPVLVVAGCMAERKGASLRERFPEIDFAMGTSARETFPRILEAAESGNAADAAVELAVAAVTPFAFSVSHLEEGAFRSLVPVMHGCDGFCSYCVVPFVRGRETSRDPRLVAEEIRLVGARGVREVTLLGQNVNSYRWDGGAVGFPELLRISAEAAADGGVGWLRFLSANPKDLSPETIRVMAGDPRFCRHLHLCVQHGSDRVLRAMNRGYDRAGYLALVREVRAAMPGISLTTDILVGFPGETEDDVAELLSLMDEVRFQSAFTYRYNAMEGTAAAAMPDQVPDEVKRERLSRVIALQRRHTAEALRARVGERATVLVEGISRKNADELVMRTERDEMVVAPGPASAIGSFAEVALSGLRGNTFRAAGIASKE